MHLLRHSVPAALLLGLIATPAPAAEDESVAADAGETDATDAPDHPQWSGNVTVGFLSTSGNTESKSTNVDVEAKLDYETWRHTLVINGFQASEDGEDIAERYGGRLQSDYRITERAYLFVVGRYESDRFGPFDRRASLALGIGRRFIDAGAVTLDLEAGAGRRVSEPDGTNERNTETIGVLRGDFAWQLSAASQFSQKLEVESGDLNTSTRSVTALESKLAGNLSWVVSYTVEHNSDVPDDLENTDTYTAVSLQYGF